MSRVLVFGSNSHGQLGHLKEELKSSGAPIEMSALGNLNVVAASCGEDFTLFLTSSGEVFSIGRGTEGQLGNLAFRNSHVPVQAQLGQRRIVKIAAGHSHSLALSSEGELLVFGRIHRKQAGALPTFGLSVSLPGLETQRILKQSSLDYFAGSAEGESAAEALDVSNFGSFAAQSRHPFVVVESGVTDIAAGYAFSLFVKSDGNLYSFGFNDAGQCGLSHRFNIDLESPQRVGLPENFTIRGIAAGQQHAVAFGDEGIYVWGNGSLGQLGPGGSSLFPRKLTVPGFDSVQQVSCGAHFSLGRTVEGKIFFWGHQEYGQSGEVSAASDWDIQIGPRSARQLHQHSKPRQLKELTADLLAAGFLHTITSQSGVVRSFGHPTSGCLGRGKSTGSAPGVIRLPKAGGAGLLLDLSAGRRHSCIVQKRSLLADHMISAFNAQMGDFSVLLPSSTLRHHHHHHHHHHHRGKRKALFVHEHLLRIRCPRLFRCHSFFDRFCRLLNVNFVEVFCARSEVVVRAFLIYLYANVLNCPPHKLIELAAVARSHALPHLLDLIVIEEKKISSMESRSASSMIVSFKQESNHRKIADVHGPLGDSFSEDLIRYQRESTDRDVLFGKDSDLHAHRWFLMHRNEAFFKKMDHFVESTQSQLNFSHLADQFEEKALKGILRYLYTGQTTIDGDTVLELWRAADYFALPELSLHCELFVEKNVDEDNVILLLFTADTLNEPSVRGKMISFILNANEESFRSILVSECFELYAGQLPINILREIDRHLSKTSWWTKKPGEFVRIAMKSNKN